MSTIYTRYLNGIKIRLGKYSESEYAIYIGCKLYALIDNLADANREYQQVNASTLFYLGF